jgi:hypothetical protein
MTIAGRLSAEKSGKTEEVPEEFVSWLVDMRKRGAEPPTIAAKRSKNAAHGTSRGSQAGNEWAPEGRKNS